MARWPGSAPDSHIFRTSAIGHHLEGTSLTDCCVLYNIAVTLREPNPEDCDTENDGCAADLHSQYHGRETGNAVRQHITNTYF